MFYLFKMFTGYPQREKLSESDASSIFCPKDFAEQIEADQKNLNPSRGGLTA